MDVEASGADPQRGDRVIEIAAVWPEGEWHSLVRAPTTALALMVRPFPDKASDAQATALASELSKRPINNSEREALAQAGLSDLALTQLSDRRRRGPGRLNLTAGETKAVLDVRHGREPRAVCAAALCGIWPGDLSEAPRWEDDGGPSDVLLRILRGRVPFMYEAPHDVRMISHEQMATGRESVEELTGAVCLRRGAQDAGLVGSREDRRVSLREICDAIGYSYTPHSALEDARAAAVVLETIAARGHPA